MFIQEAKNRTFLTFPLHVRDMAFLVTNRKFAYPFKGLTAEFPQFLVKARWDIVAGIESMGGDGECREGR